VTLAALVLTNLLYLAGAVVVATLVSALYVLRHRKPKSMESAIESFSRELRALAPDEEIGGPGRTEGRADGQPRSGPAAGQPSQPRSGPTAGQPGQEAGFRRLPSRNVRPGGRGDAPASEGQAG
jgi:hypothetical protein